MALTTPIAAGTAAANSADIAVAAATPANIGIFATAAAPLPTFPSCKIQRKDPNGNYRDTGIELSRQSPDVYITALGTYRVVRQDLTQPAINPGAVSVGVMMDQ